MEAHRNGHSCYRCFKGLELLPVSIRLTIFFGLPCICLAVALGLLFGYNTSLRADLGQMQQMVQLVRIMDKYAHQIEQERGVTSQWYLNNNAYATAKLNQRALTDVERPKLLAFLSVFPLTAFGDNGDLQAAAADLNLQIASWSIFQASVDAGTTTRTQSRLFYIAHLATCWRIMQELATESTDSDITVMLQAYSSIQQQKDIWGQERGSLSPLFDTKVVTATAYRDARDLVTQETLFQRQFDIYAPPAMRTFYSAVSESIFFATFVAARDGVIALFEVPANAATFNVTSAQYYAVATTMIEASSAALHSMGMAIKNSVDLKYDAANKEIILVSVVTSLLLALGILFGFGVAYSIQNPFKRLELSHASMSIELTERNRIAGRAVSSAERLRAQLREAEDHIEQLDVIQEQHVSDVMACGEHMMNMSSDLSVFWAAVTRHAAQCSQQDSSAAAARAASAHATNLINQMKAFAVEKYQTLTVNLERINTNEFLQSVAAMMFPWLKQHNAELTLQLSTATVAVCIEIDPLQFQLAIHRILAYLLEKCRTSEIVLRTSKQSGFLLMQLSAPAAAQVTREDPYELVSAKRIIGVMNGGMELRLSERETAVEISLALIN
eukprot:TRINITY_DN15565_c0_g1_i1.p1 TRINITY_DN15565_c0_g1~~TRINITY_DN15565_c0_g1_i1.p1  ORF type:complete len:613 (+),score=130.65 TRINITY_DN15565_c0_g1_i1:106-1944(+)